MICVCVCVRATGNFPSRGAYIYSNVFCAPGLLITTYNGWLALYPYISIALEEMNGS